MVKPSSARKRFAAALALYLVWVGVLAGMAVTTSKRPPARLIPPAAGEDMPAHRPAVP